MYRAEFSPYNELENTVIIELEHFDTWNGVVEEAALHLGVPWSEISLRHIEEGDYPLEALEELSPNLDFFVQWAGLELHDRDVVHGFIDSFKGPGIRYLDLDLLMQDAERYHVGSIDTDGSGMEEFFEEWFYDEHGIDPHPSILDAINLNDWLVGEGFAVDFNSTGNVYG